MRKRVIRNNLKPGDIGPSMTRRILQWLNSLTTTEEIRNIVDIYPGKMMLGARVADRILSRKAELGSFRSLQQVYAIPGVGLKRFNAIVYAKIKRY